MCVLVKRNDSLVRSLKLNFNKEELKMKKLLLNLLVFMAKDVSVLQVSHILAFGIILLKWVFKTSFYLLSMLLDIPGREGDASFTDAREAIRRLPQPLVKFPLLVIQPPGGAPAVRPGHSGHRSAAAAGRLHAVSGELLPAAAPGLVHQTRWEQSDLWNYRNNENKYYLGFFFHVIWGWKLKNKMWSDKSKTFSPSDDPSDQDSGVRRGLEGVGGLKKAQMQHCVRVLRSVTSSGEELINQDLCDQNAISQLLGNKKFFFVLHILYYELWNISAVSCQRFWLGWRQTWTRTTTWRWRSRQTFSSSSRCCARATCTARWRQFCAVRI